MITILLVGAGGFAGSVLRYIMNREVQQLLASPAGFPYGVLAVNVAGCFIIGLLGGLAASHGWFNPAGGTRALLFVGFLGGFTTFSAFGFDTFNLMRDGALAQAIANVALQVCLGLGAVWAGYRLGIV